MKRCGGCWSAICRLALQHKAGRELIASTDRRALEDEIVALQASAPSSPPPLRRLQERRLELARRRVERLELAGQRVQLVAQQLAAIAEMIHFLHEQALAHRPTRSPGPTTWSG